MVDAPKTARVVAVVSDGSGLAEQSAAGPVSPALTRHARLIQQVAGVPAKVIALATGRHLPNVVDGLAADVGVVFLPHTEHHRAARVQATTSGPPVITGQDMTAIALTAALLTTLSRAGRAPDTGRVVIAGEQTLPVLCPLLIAAGIGDITTWRPTDAIAFPLSRLAAGAHAVIILPARPDGIQQAALSAVSSAADAGPAVIVADETRHSLIALPGLLRAIMRGPRRMPDVEVYLACALALVMATPPDQQLPPRPDRALADRIADWIADRTGGTRRNPVTPPYPRGEQP